METSISMIEELVKRTEAYSKTSYELAKLKSLKTTTTVATSLLARAAVVMMLMNFAFMMNFGLSLWLGELLGKSYYGFFIVAGFYFIVALILYFFLLSWIKKPMSNLIIKQALQ